MLTTIENLKEGDLFQIKKNGTLYVKTIYIKNVHKYECFPFLEHHKRDAFLKKGTKVIKI